MRTYIPRFIALFVVPSLLMDPSFAPALCAPAAVNPSFGISVRLTQEALAAAAGFSRREILTADHDHPPVLSRIVQVWRSFKQFPRRVLIHPKLTLSFASLFAVIGRA